MKTLTAILFCLTMLALACGTLFGSDQGLPDGVVNQASGDIRTNVSNNANLKTIYSNLGTKTDTYDKTTGWLVHQANCSGSSHAQFMAMPFTPKANATVTQIQAAVQWQGSGVNGANLILATDASGLPGKTLHSWNLKNLANQYTCCKLATAKYANGIKVKKGKQYWVVAQTDAKSLDACDVWDFAWNDMKGNIGYNLGAGWMTEISWVSAFAVRGN
jgi:hypothetical protein